MFFGKRKIRLVGMHCGKKARRVRQLEADQGVSRLFMIFDSILHLSRAATIASLGSLGWSNRGEVVYYGALREGTCRPFETLSRRRRNSTSVERITVGNRCHQFRIVVAGGEGPLRKRNGYKRSRRSNQFQALSCRSNLSAIPSKCDSGAERVNCRELPRARSAGPETVCPASG
jgi:hypothetical protein